MSFHQSPNVARLPQMTGDPDETLNTSLSRSASDAGVNWDKSLNVTDDGSYTAADVTDSVVGVGSLAGAVAVGVPGFGIGQSSSDAEKTLAAIRHLQSKVDTTMARLKQAQAAKEENVQDYLQALTQATDKHQKEALKAMFEKRNNKTSQTIWQLQRKLEEYERRKSDLRVHGGSMKVQGSRQPKEMLKDVSQGLKHVSGNIKDGITGLSGTVMSKPREFAHLIRNKFGSADNISSMQQSKTVFYIDESPNSEGRDRHGSSTLPARLQPQKDANALQVAGDQNRDDWKGSGNVMPSSNDGFGVGGDSRGAMGGIGEDGSIDSEAASSHLNSSPVKLTKAHSGESGFNHGDLITEYRALRSSVDRLRDELLEHVVNHNRESSELSDLSSMVWEDRARMEHHEEELNDVIDFHQKSAEAVKTSIATMEERLMYQMDEKFRDLQDLLEACSNRVLKLEHQYAQHAQVVSFDNIQNRNFRAVIVRLVNFCLGILQLVLFTATIISDVVTPFVRTRYHLIVSVVFAAAAVLGVKKWSKLAGFVARLWNRQKSPIVDAVVSSASSGASAVPNSSFLGSIFRCPSLDFREILSFRCPSGTGPMSAVETAASTVVSSTGSSSTSTLVVCCFCGLAALAAILVGGTRGLRVAVAVGVVILAVGVVLPL